jgi:[ribosomal protein S18]-alanine N-acetyltransferase
MATRESAALGSESAFSIARITEHDLLEVVEIEELSGLSVWGWDAYHHELQSPADAIMLAAKIPAGVFSLAGFIVARLVAGELHINNVAVRPEFRGYGVGTTLLKSALDDGKNRGAKLAVLEVRAGNIVAQRLYERCGFEISGRQRNYYRQPVEDALLMACLLESSP